MLVVDWSHVTSSHQRIFNRCQWLVFYHDGKITPVSCNTKFWCTPCLYRMIAYNVDTLPRLAAEFNMTVDFNSSTPGLRWVLRSRSLRAKFISCTAWVGRPFALFPWSRVSSFEVITLPSSTSNSSINRIVNYVFATLTWQLVCLMKGSQRKWDIQQIVSLH